MKLARFAFKLIRLAMKKGDKKRMKNYVYPTGENVIPDMKYLENGAESQSFDLIKSEHPSKRLLIHFHGGAYVGGSRKNIYPYAEVFLKQGYDVCLPDYRLVNEKTKINVLDQVNDCLSFLSFFLNRLEEYGLADRQIVLGGDSAGGQFALLIQQILDDPEFAKQWGYDFSGFKSKCAVLSCPVYDFESFISSKILTKGAKRFIFGEGCLEPNFGYKISPKAHIDSLKSPVFISTCKNDFLNSPDFKQSDLLSKDLTQRNITFGIINIDSSDEKITHVHNVNNPEYEESERVNEAALSFLDECF